MKPKFPLFKDDNTLKEERFTITKLLTEAARLVNVDPLSVFRARSCYWAREFEEEMRRRMRGEDI